MVDFPSRAELTRRGRDALLAVPNARFSPREVDREGSDLNVLLNAIGFMADEVARRSARAFAACFEATAKGADLDRVVFDRKGLPRLPAAPAVVRLSLSRPTFAAGGGTIDGGPLGGTPAPARIRAGSGPTYVLLEPATFGATALGPITVDAQAEVAGTAYAVAAGARWSWTSSVFDASIVATNAEDAAGAADDETDEAYYLRARDFWRSVRRGVQGAIEFGLRGVPGVASVSVEEVVDEAGVPAAFVRAYILDALGRANETFAARARRELLSWRALGIPVVVEAGVVEYTPITYRARFDTRIVNDSAAAGRAQDTALVSRLMAQRPGQILERAAVLSALRSVPGAVVYEGDLVAPAGDLIPATPASAFRTRRDLIVRT